MREQDQSGLSPEFRRAMEGLPREREPSAGLEDRTVQALRQRGLVAPSWSSRPRRPVWLSWVGVAAALVIFAAGTLLGHRLGSSSAVVVLAPAPDGDPRETAAYVQRTGSAHAAAIRNLAAAVQSAEVQDVDLAREVSLAALRASLEALTRLDPNDPTPALLLAQVQPVEASAIRGPADRPWVVWF
ncbi:MAG: hypothetical protein JSW43_08875 [Gemmatimonadota bacterium]|nr:MAG: hypothetical protein JSW43_08875 [Gemmatimonadota bacterium]